MKGCDRVLRYGETWYKIYQKTHSPSFTQFKQLKLKNPLILEAGEILTFYIHSSDRSDQAIVYDNARGRHEIFQDDVLCINVGRAHLSTTPNNPNTRTMKIWILIPKNVVN